MSRVLFRRAELLTSALDLGSTSVDLSDYATTGLRIVAVGPSGIGKTNAGLLIAEQLAAQGWMVVCVDQAPAVAGLAPRGGGVMADKTGIAWTDATWNPIRGCSRVSEGCRHCYAEVVAARFSGKGLAYEGLTKNGKWTGEVRFVEETLDRPLRWKKPRRIFVNSMSDLFHEKVPDEWIDRIFAVMALAPQHIFQVLTKRPERMIAYLSEPERQLTVLDTLCDMGKGSPSWWKDWITKLNASNRVWANLVNPWPLPNVHLGVSVEDQATADARIPLLLQTPAAVRWVSYEPALSSVDFSAWIKSTVAMVSTCGARVSNEQTLEAISELVKVVTRRFGQSIDWLVVGGESGSGARPFDLAWARSAIAQCRAADVPCFVKQFGAHPVDSALQDVMCNGQRHYTRRAEDPFIADAEARIADGRAPGYSVVPHRMRLSDRKGADPTEWPADLRVQEFPR